VIAAMPRGARAVIAAVKATNARESTVNELGYQYLQVDRRPADAVKLFRENVRRNPESAAAWDSYADSLDRTGSKVESEKAREKSVALRAAARLRSTRRLPAVSPQ